MAELTKPSAPVVNGKTVFVESVAGAVRYTLYRVRYILRNVVTGYFKLSDGRSLLTSDGRTFETKNSTEMYTSSYTGEQIDEAVQIALNETST